MTPIAPAPHQAIAGLYPQAVSSVDFATIAELVRMRSGIVIGLDKAYLVESRLQNVVRTNRLSGLAELSAKLRSHPTELLIRDVVEAMTTNETLFFRDTRPFEHLRTTALPAMHAARSHKRPLRIWSAASSSGQEAYSIAVTVMESGLDQHPLQILGTDISTEQLGRARLGFYSNFEVQRGLSASVLGKHFQKAHGGWQIRDTVRRMVEFRQWNLMDDLYPLGTFDLIFCRNVLIYFDVHTKRRVLNAIWSRLVPGGWLYLGGAETTLGISNKFVPCPGTHQVYTSVKE